MPPLKRKNCFDPEWEKQFGFVKKSKRGDGFFYCSVCQNDFILTMGVNGVEKHQDSKSHKQYSTEGRCFKSPEQNTSKIAAVPRPTFTDSMFAQAIKETNIDEAEKKMATLIDSLHTVQQNIAKLEKNGRQIDVELLSRLRSLSVQIGSEKRELQVRQVGLQKARETFVLELSDYEVMIVAKLDTMEHMGEQLKELVASIERSALSGPELPTKPVMIDKEVQAIPERTLFRSPTAEMDFTSSRIAQLPISPVLRTTASKPKPPEDYNKAELVTPRKILF